MLVVALSIGSLGCNREGELKLPSAKVCLPFQRFKVIFAVFFIAKGSIIWK